MKVKRLFSLLLALTMAMSLLGGICLTASAVEQEMPVIEISGIPDAVIGEAAVNGDAIVPEGAGYTAEYQWLRVGHDGVNKGVFEGVFESGEIYGFYVWVRLKADWDGWQFYNDGEDMAVQIVVNGGEQVWDETLYSSNVQEGYLTIVHLSFCFFTEEIQNIEITGVPEIMPGNVVSTDNIGTPDGAPYTIASAEWSGHNNGDIIQPGENYHLSFSVIPKEGYHLAEDCKVYVNGQLAEVNLCDGFELYSYINFMCPYQKIDTVELSYTVEQPKGGDAANVDTLTVPTDANYRAYAYWYEYEEINDEYRVADRFEGGKEYFYGITIWPEDGYEFSEDVVVIANGAVLDSDAYSNDYGWRIAINKESYMAEATEPVEPNEISYVALSDLQAPVAGELLDDSVTVLTEGCTAELNWSVYDGEGVLPVTGAAEKGKEYCLDITLTADEGYSFAEEIQIWLDGEYSWGYSWGGNTVEQSFWYDTFEVIESVEITSTDKGELGAAATTDGVSVPEGANYSVSAYWGVLNMDEGLVPFEGVFADNTVYAYTVNAEPAEGYKFAEELTVTYNGEPVGEDFCYYDNYTLEVIGEVFTGTMQKVRKVEINARFKAGMKASDAVVEVPEDAPYEITEYYWVDVETGDELTGKFVAGKQYGLMTYITPKAGYVIDLGAQAMVNGTEDYEFINSMYQYVYGYTAVILDCESSDTNGNPSTGDDSELMLPVVLMILSVIGLVSVVMTPKKRYR